MIAAIGIVVPVHDEAAHLPACLRAIDRARAALPPAIACAVVVVLDKCTDRSAVIAEEWARGDEDRRVLAIDARNVGRARALGIDSALEILGNRARSQTWLATTDADSEVPAAWLTEQVAMAAEGADAVAGSIHVADWSGFPEGIDDRFRRFYEPPGSGDTHTHVHGANLGVRADAYLEAGGFEPLSTGEDHALWNALHRVARPRISSRRIPVVTSARLFARAPAGFSGFLQAFLAGEPFV